MSDSIVSSFVRNNVWKPPLEYENDILFVIIMLYSILYTYCRETE